MMAGDARPDPSAYVRTELRALSRYHLDLSPCGHKLDQNEVPYDLPRLVKRRIARRWLSRDWARYPDFHADALRAALGEAHGWPAEGVLVGNGSNELLGVVLEAIAGPERAVVFPVPSFGLYPMLVLRAGATPVSVGPADDACLPMASLLEAAGRHPDRPMILCTPNNPTGDAATVEDVDALLKVLDAPLVLDNAYGEFCDHDYRTLLARHRHLVILRTFSKAWSLAGQRLGYLLADPALVAELIKVKLPYNLGHASAIAGEEVLAAARMLDRRVVAIRARRPQWAAMLAARGFFVFPSEANFVLARTPNGVDVTGLQRDLEASGVRVRDVSRYPGLDGCFRVSVGHGADLRATARALDRLGWTARPAEDT